MLKLEQKNIIITYCLRILEFLHLAKINLMDDNFSPRVKDVITYSKEEALRLGHDFIGTEHLVLGLIRSGEGKAIEILNFLDVDLNVLRKKLNP